MPRQDATEEVAALTPDELRTRSIETLTDARNAPVGSAARSQLLAEAQVYATLSGPVPAVCHVANVYGGPVVGLAEGEVVDETTALGATATTVKPAGRRRKPAEPDDAAKAHSADTSEVIR